MNITLSDALRSLGGGVQKNSSRDQQIKQQIKKLEKQQQRIIKKIAGLSGGGAAAAAPAAASGASVSTETKIAGTGTGDASDDQAASTALRIGEGLRAIQQSAAAAASSSESSDPTLDNMSLEELMKMLQLVNMQILNLQNMLGEAYSGGGGDDDEGGGSVAIGHAGSDAGTGEAAPAPEIVDGHVDGYA